MALHPSHLSRLIQLDHQKAEAIISSLVARRSSLVAGRGDRRRLVDVLIHDLAIHAGAEELVVYPQLRQLDGGTEQAEQAVDDHAAMKDFLVLVDRYEPGDEQFGMAAVLPEAAAAQDLVVG